MRRETDKMKRYRQLIFLNLNGYLDRMLLFGAIAPCFSVLNAILAEDIGIIPLALNFFTVVMLLVLYALRAVLIPQIKVAAVTVYLSFFGSILLFLTDFETGAYCSFF